jgi:high-affinity Fe2+/Pb2+ permease
MRVPFFVWSGVIAGIVYAGFVGMDYMNFGEINLSLDLAKMVGGVWLALVIASMVIGWVRREAARKPLDEPDPHFGSDSDD